MKKLLLFLAIALLSSCSASRARFHKSNKNNFTDNSKSTSVLKKRNNSLEDFARVLQVDVKHLENTALYRFINQWLGSPHKMGGLKKSGIDCSAFVSKVYDEVYQIDLPRISRDMANKIEKKSINHLAEGDLVFFSFGKKRIDHVGIYLHNKKFLHVSTKKGVIISDLKDVWYSKYYAKGGSFKN